jgi:hypothetical protein
MEPPEFEPEFYEQQVKLMEKRFAILFKRWKLSWNAFSTHVNNKLHDNIYWKWIFWCGFESEIKEVARRKKGRREYLYENSDKRIRKIIGDYFTISSYIEGL